MARPCLAAGPCRAVANTQLMHPQCGGDPKITADGLIVILGTMLIEAPAYHRCSSQIVPGQRVSGHPDWSLLENSLAFIWVL